MLRRQCPCTALRCLLLPRPGRRTPRPLSARLRSSECGSQCRRLRSAILTCGVSDSCSDLAPMVLRTDQTPCSQTGDPPWRGP
uniref:Uncharacterized protein n=1 Tax=uncultured marine virus TaxID=186617 RepID=A0A0F7L808_9VIRU|nr:hypothetical protein [uncultured marine virus]